MLMLETRVPIGAEFRGRYRVWKTAVQRQANRIEEVFYSPLVSAAAGDFVRCTRSGRERAFGRLRCFLEEAGARLVDRVEARRARWAYLSPKVEGWVQAIIFTVSRHDFGGHTWLISFGDHALQRALQRSPSGLDLTGLCWDAIEAARGLSMRFFFDTTSGTGELASGPVQLKPGRTLRRFRIAAGAGAFACNLAGAEGWGGEWMPLIECKTWLASDQMSRLQELEVVPEGQPGGDRFDELYTVFRRKWRMTPIIRHRSERARRAMEMQ